MQTAVRPNIEKELVTQLINAFELQIALMFFRTRKMFGTGNLLCEGPGAPHPRENEQPHWASQGRGSCTDDLESKSDVFWLLKMAGSG